MFTPCCETEVEACGVSMDIDASLFSERVQENHRVPKASNSNENPAKLDGAKLNGALRGDRRWQFANASSIQTCRKA